MLQWIVPIATEAPELVVAFVLLTHGRGGQSLAVLLAGAVSQYTLALGTLPLAYQLGLGGGPLPLPGRERIELFLTVGVALYAVASLIMLRLSRGDSAMMLVLFTAQFLLPSVFTPAGLRGGLLGRRRGHPVAERRHAAAAPRDAPPRRRATDPVDVPARTRRNAAREVAPVADAAVRVHGHELEPRARRSPPAVR